ncbi:hypothetical protein AVEN_199684-1 [Araneus ventricosus]|uniref:Uncharacterized protein n=1 Tax=Araneus ventricosus TaxID=182803 RepID=A0A4Y2DH34_ARAVE|nr:hypothetical protein AVEN_199684-1 [Araneus ventricosus]
MIPVSRACNFIQRLLSLLLPKGENLRRNRRTTLRCFSDQAPGYKKEVNGTSDNGNKIQEILLSPQRGRKKLVTEIMRIVLGGSKAGDKRKKGVELLIEGVR